MTTTTVVKATDCESLGEGTDILCLQHAISHSAVAVVVTIVVVIL
jgi:hypothetical protein